MVAHLDVVFQVDAGLLDAGTRVLAPGGNLLLGAGAEDAPWVSHQHNHLHQRIGTCHKND